jgi:hypothetical protein
LNMAREYFQWAAAQGHSEAQEAATWKSAGRHGYWSSAWISPWKLIF